ncbi:MAG: AraC family transcriptional regulator ligand-binding domain-containing protein [Moraxellaceae bacterium]|nr:AraC family transcriptional regulator ligand-binding domain-containing protein [Moraxellaceae bacterium]
MSNRSILGMLYILRGLHELGEDITPVLDRYGIDLNKVDPTARIERSLELKIYVEVAYQLKDPLAGLKIGTFFGFAGYGPLTMLLMTCANAYEALQIGIRYQQLTFLFGHLSFEPGENQSALVIAPITLPEKAYRFRVDGELSGTYKLLRDMQQALGVSMHALRVEVPYACPDDADAYETHFNCPVEFGGSPNIRFWIDNTTLQLRFPTADPTAHAMYKTLCDQQLVTQRHDMALLTDKVLSHLDLFSERFPNAASVASVFDIAERTLRRQLSEENTSFRELLDQVRFRKAQMLLTGSALPVESIAVQLGYAESAAFIHAFQRWSGTTPAAFRNSKRK